MSNLSLTCHLDTTKLSETEAVNANQAFKKASISCTDALNNIHPSIRFEAFMTNLPEAQEETKAKGKQLSYQQGVNDTHFFYLSGLFFLFLFMGGMTLAEQLHDSLPEAAKAEFASLVEGGKVFLAATMENGRVVLGAIGEAALICFAAVKVKVLEAVAEYSRNEF